MSVGLVYSGAVCPVGRGVGVLVVRTVKVVVVGLAVILGVVEAVYEVRVGHRPSQ